MMMRTRAQALKDAETKIKYLNSELNKTQSLNIKLINEQDECAEEYKRLVNQIECLKSKLVEQEIEIKDTRAEKNKLVEALEQNSENMSLYENALQLINIHENNATMFDNLLKNAVHKNKNEIEALTIDNNALKQEVSNLQSQIIQLKLDNTSANKVQVISKKKRNTTDPCSRISMYKETASKVDGRQKITNIRKNGVYNNNLDNAQIRKSILTLAPEKLINTSIMELENQQTFPRNDIDNSINVTNNISIVSNVTHNQQPLADNKCCGNMEQNKKKKQMLILCDAFGRNLATFIKNNSTQYESVISICKPNAPINEVIKDIVKLTELMKTGDDVIVIGSRMHMYNISNVKSMIALCENKKINLQMTTLPYKYKQNLDNVDNDRKHIINNKLYNLAAVSPIMSVIDVNCYKRKFYHNNGNLSIPFVNFLYDQIVLRSSQLVNNPTNNLIYVTIDFNETKSQNEINTSTKASHCSEVNVSNVFLDSNETKPQNEINTSIIARNCSEISVSDDFLDKPTNINIGS